MKGGEEIRMSKRRLNERQIAAIEYLSMPKRGGMTYGEIAEAVGVSERQLYTWRQDDVFADAVVKRTIQRSAEYLPEILESIPKHIIEDGNAAMFRTYLQSIGALTEKVEIGTNNTTDADVDKMREQIEKLRKGSE